MAGDIAMTVWKFPFDIEDDIGVEMPRGARVLHVDAQFGRPCLWALVAPAAPKEVRRFRLAGTGHPLPPLDRVIFDWIHVGSFQMAGGQLVWHLFEVSPPPKGA